MTALRYNIIMIIKKVYNYLETHEPIYELALEKGVVIKIQDYHYNEIDYHNHWGVIIANTKNYFTIFVDNHKNDIINIKLENIKWVIGTLEMDCVDIGENRHTTEVIPLINKALRYHFNKFIG